MELNKINEINIKLEEGFEFLVFILSVSCKYKEFDDYLPKILDYKDNVANDVYKIKKSEKKILLEKISSDLLLIKSVGTLLMTMMGRLESGLTKYDYDVINRFAQIYSKDRKEVQHPTDILDELLFYLDTVELRCRLFVNCCFMKKIQNVVEGIKKDPDSLELDYTEEEFNKDLDELDEIVNSRDIVRVKENPDLDEEEKDKIFKYNALVDSMLSIYDIFVSLGPDSVKFPFFPRCLKTLIDEWKVEMTQQCNLLKKYEEKAFPE